MSVTTAATAAMPPIAAKSPDTNAAILPADYTLVYNVYIVLLTVMSPEMTMIAVVALVFVSLESASKFCFDRVAPRHLQPLVSRRGDGKALSTLGWRDQSGRGRENDVVVSVESESSFGDLGAFSSSNVACAGVMSWQWVLGSLLHAGCIQLSDLPPRASSGSGIVVYS
ncbi:hypothetical protein ARMGADRAFT_1079853 [Armillaria gallica]|uniref:Uncharacterized protein n=1 Tax=Armillaria gallica TaxID=47427 RepID=A0A2H3DZ09_ARMGA|nr:hypothetical protein ARMGADRAFT_1079853 [Armillaria gallica]